MSASAEDWPAYQRRLWSQTDHERFIRPDAARFLRPDADRWRVPPYPERKYRADQRRDDLGRFALEGGGGGGRGLGERRQRHRVRV